MNSVASISRLLQPIVYLRAAVRSTWILRRKYEPYLSKLETENPKRLRSKHQIYEVVDCLNQKRELPISVFLTDDVEGLGLKGTIVEVKPRFARKHILLPQRGVYVTPENLKKYESRDTSADTQESFSSPFAAMTIRELSSRPFPMVMHGDNKWTIEKWHVMLALREFQFIAPEAAVEFPRDGQISGPNPDLEDKEFFAYVTINNKEKTAVRFRIEHHYREIERRPKKEEFYWENPAGEVFPEDKEVLDELRANYDRFLKEEERAKAAKNAAASTLK